MSVHAVARPSRVNCVSLLILTFLIALTYVLAGAAHLQGQTPDNPKHEFRSAWITTAWAIDWPTGSTPSAQQQSMIEILDQLKDQNMNAVVFQASPRGDAYYDSDRLPWAANLSGTPGQDPGWDPLQFVIDESRKRGLDVHVWFNVYTTAYNSASDSDGQHGIPNVRYANPGWMEDGVWMNPGFPEAREWQIANVAELVERYDIDAIHFDRIRYSSGGYDRDASLKEDHNPDGISGLDNWRRHNVNEFVRLVHENIRPIRPDIKIGATPLGHYDTGSTDGWGAQFSYSDAFQDSRLWAEEGYVDYIAPQIYWTLGTEDPPRFAFIANEWVESRRNKRHLYIGIGPYKDGTSNQVNIKAELPEQIGAVRDAGAEGKLFYSNSDIASETFGGRFDHPALVPPMPWLDTTQPAAVRNPEYQIDGDKITLTWDAPDTGSGDAEAIRYVVYRNDDPDNPGDPSATEDPGNIVAVTGELSVVDDAPDGYGSESGAETAWFVTALSRNNVEGPAEVIIPGDADTDPDPDAAKIEEIPYFEDFSEAGVPDLPEGWQNIGDVATYDGPTAIGGTTLEFPTGIAGDDFRIAVTPEIADGIDISSLTVTFNSFATSTLGDERIEVGFMTDPSDPGSFTLVETVSLPDEQVVDEPTINLDNHTEDDGRYLAFKAGSPSDFNRFFIGYVEIDFDPDKEAVLTREISGQAGWRMLSLPVSGVTVSDLAGQNQIQGISGANDFYSEHSEIEFETEVEPNFLFKGSSDWDAPADFDTEIASGQGFIWYFWDEDDAPSADLPFDLSVNGVAPSADVTVEGLHSGFNLVGNPFAEDLDVSGLTGWGNEDLSSGIAQVWDNSGTDVAGEGHSGTWRLIGDGGADGSEIADWQGFMIENNGEPAANSLTIPVAASGGSGADFYKSAPAEEHRLSLNLHCKSSDGQLQTSDGAVHMLFRDDASHDWDRFDATKLTPLSGHFATLAFVGERSGDQVLKAQESRPMDFEGELELPLAFHTRNMGGEFTISWDGLSELPEAWEVTLIDNVLEQSVNMRDASEHIFSHNENQKAVKAADITPDIRPMTAQDAGDASDGEGERFTVIISSDPVSAETPADKPGELALDQNYPNPFNPSTVISYEVPEQQHVRLAVYDVTGRKISLLVDQVRSPGTYEVTWDTGQLASGVYMYRLEAGGEILTRQMTLLK